MKAVSNYLLKLVLRCNLKRFYLMWHEYILFRTALVPPLLSAQKAPSVLKCSFAFIFRLLDS